MYRSTAIVWFRRDLRLHDHRALARADRENEYVLPTFIFDDALLRHPLTGMGRVQYMLESLADLDTNLRRSGGYLMTRRGVPHEELARLCHETGATRIYYHEDTDRQYGIERDATLQRQLPGIEVIAVPDNGVFLAPDARQGWAKKWETRMDEPLASPPPVMVQPTLSHYLRTLGVPTLADLGLPPSDQIRVTPGGETWARRRMAAYLQSGVREYRHSIGHPFRGEDVERAGTSRLSAPLSFGCLSLRTVVQESLRQMEAERQGNAANARMSTTPADGNRQFFHSRLYWHDHFTQKQRDWPQAQFETINPVYDEIRQSRNDDHWQAWTHGLTGYPLVDAAMRCLRATGFLNFRTRAMVAAFWSYDLWQPWRDGAEWFQRQLIDFDTGINHQQWQMQAGTVGSHANRFYNPTEQAYQYDALGLFIARYVPELASVPMPQRVTPWQLSLDDQARYGVYVGKTYPSPIVDHVAATRFARAEFKRLAPSAKAFLQTPEGRRRASSERSVAPPTEKLTEKPTVTLTRIRACASVGQLALEF